VNGTADGTADGTVDGTTNGAAGGTADDIASGKWDNIGDVDRTVGATASDLVSIALAIPWFLDCVRLKAH
jgi:hypothetical protein